MIRVRDSLSRKLTTMNLMVSGAALLLASIAFFAYDLITFRNNLRTSTSIQAQIIGENSISPLIFNDPDSAQKTLAALHTSPHIVYGAIYTANGSFFAGYWRQDRGQRSYPLPRGAVGERETSRFEGREFEHTHTIFFQGKPVGIVYIRSDLTALSDRLKSYAIILILILSASLLAALAVSRLSQRRISRPILQLAETAQQVSREKDFNLRAPQAGDSDEVAALVQSFNEMLQEIQVRDSELQERERQFRTLADSIPQMAWMAEASGDLFWYNHRWFEYTGTTPEQMEGWGWQTVHDPQKLPEVLTQWRASLATGEPFRMVFPLRAADGSYREFLTLALPVRGVSGKVVRWFGTNTDITEQHRAEEALRRTEKLAATGRLAASIAHEINNPLEAVTNLVYLAKKQPQNLDRYLQLAEHELDRIAQITRNTLGFYRDSASSAAVDVSEVLQEVARLYERKLQFKRVSLLPEYGNDLTILAYPGELRQIFANLIANAIEALPDRGCLRIRASKAHLWKTSPQPGVRITFLDNGSGIPPAIRRRIFEPFFTTKKDVGTGLGLWLTANLVQKHRGLISIRSSIRPGRTWTAVSVFLPLQPPEQ
jgi:PAS domain S-box-containing protein